jgi:hypothetical protein
MAGLPALPVRRTQKTLRQIVIEADPEYVVEDRNPVEYEFPKHTFRGNYKIRGPYEP